MPLSEFETKMVPIAGLACIAIAIVAFALYLSYSYATPMALIAGLFLAIGVALLGVWAWIRWADKAGKTTRK